MQSTEGSIPDENLTQSALALAIDELLGVGQLEVHVAVGADEGAGVLGVAPLETDADLLAHPAMKILLEKRGRVGEGLGARRRLGGVRAEYVQCEEHGARVNGHKTLGRLALITIAQIARGLHSCRAGLGGRCS